MPLAAFEAVGDTLTKSLIRGDFGLYQSLMHLPLLITPRDGLPYVLRTEPDLRQDFDLYHANIKAHAVTDIFRQPIEITQTAPDRIKARCLTHIMAGAHRIVDPFETQFLLFERPDGWRITEIESSEGHIKWTLERSEISNDGQFNL